MTPPPPYRADRIYPLLSPTTNFFVKRRILFSPF
ncbi:hypothetical protein [Clostridium phage Maintenon]|nr:hypothetical protein [Clostridium phage Maintenon]